MHVALIPLDSRPPSTQFPRRLAEIAGVQLVEPPTNMLGSLHHGADGVALAAWLKDAVESTAGTTGCSAVVLSWDALIHGGLIQSRRWQGVPRLEPVAKILRSIDWQQVAGYGFVTVPRLGISILDSGSWERHEVIREYFINIAQRDDPRARQQAKDMELQLGEKAVVELWEWRKRNFELIKGVVALSRELGFRRVHIAVEDNAQHGPHLAEVAELRRGFGVADASATQCSCFDGADEAACMLLSRAITDARETAPLPVQLTVHPTAPGADQYTGLFESNTLGDGLTFLAKMLQLNYSYDEQEDHWFVAHGVQPQPDVFAKSPTAVFDNPYLLPRRLIGAGSLFISDLNACNGANPRLVSHMVGQGAPTLAGLVGFNTNFNTLALSAAWMRLASGGDGAASRRFLCERLADDVVYQSIARPQVMVYLLMQNLDPLDFSAANQWQVAECRNIISRCWRDWCDATGAGVLQTAGISTAQAAGVEYSFPWKRAFEVQVTAPE